ncbi:unnamed protein product [Urochloa humidicola]
MAVTLWLSTLILASSLPSVANDISAAAAPAPGVAGKWKVTTEPGLKYLDWKNSETFSRVSSSSSSYLSAATRRSRTELSSCTPYCEPLISLITTTRNSFSTGADTRASKKASSPSSSSAVFPFQLCR